MAYFITFSYKVYLCIASNRNVCITLSICTLCIDYLVLLAPLGSHWLLLAPIGSYWLLLAPIGSHWLLLAAIGSYWLLLGPIGSY
jgi:hypothetical protein